MRRLSLPNRMWIWMAIPLCYACSPRPVKTIENLRNAVVSEQNAAVRYRAFSVQARKEGFGNIANLLEAIACSAEIHAEHQRQFLSEYGENLLAAVDSIGEVGSTIENLKMSARAETYKAKTAFPIFSAAAATEKVSDEEQYFRWMTTVALRHADHCRKALDKLQREGSDWNVVNSWSVCPRCGYPYKTASMDENCPVCSEPAGASVLVQ